VYVVLFDQHESNDLSWFIGSPVDSMACLLACLYSWQYTKDETVVVWVNRVGPFKNPQEYYFFYSLPFCPPDYHQSQAEGLGEAIQGYELTRANLEIAFRCTRVRALLAAVAASVLMPACCADDIQPKLICEKTLTAQEAAVFLRAVDERYWYQLFIDDLPVWGLVGDIVEGPDDKREHYVYTHQQFDIAYNNDRVGAPNHHHHQQQLASLLANKLE